MDGKRIVLIFNKEIVENALNLEHQEEKISEYDDANMNKKNSPENVKIKNDWPHTQIKSYLKNMI
jgi:hypothetical protein